MRSLVAALLAATSAALSSTTLLAREPNWVQVHTEIVYTRTGTMCTAKDGSFTFQLKAEIDEVMDQRASKRKVTYPSLSVRSDYARSFALSGLATLTAEAVQYDDSTKQTYKASAQLSAKLHGGDVLVVDDIGDAEPLGVGMHANVRLHLPLTGTVSSNYPRMPGVTEQDSILLWPTPIAYEKDEGKFFSIGDMHLRPELGKRPSDPAMAQLYDLSAATNGLENAPGLGGFRPPSLGAVTKLDGGGWQIIFSKTAQFDTLTGGQYTDTISVKITPCPKLTLPVPQKKSEQD